MARKWSDIAKVHRVLVSGARGADVEDVQAAARRRLSSRAYADAFLPKADGAVGAVSLDRIGDALYALGAAPETVKAARGGRVSVGAQRMIRYPGNRTDEQLGRAKARKPDVAKRARQTREADGTFASPSSGSVADCRARAAKAAKFALAHAGRRYSMAGDRWNPIASKANPDTGAMWSVADCSAFATWVLWHALGRGGPDIVNGATWASGYTGTQMQHGEHVTTGQYQPGDLAFYGNRSVGSHVVVCYQAGTAATARWASHGSPGGPYDVGLHYRGDLVEVRRYLH